MGLFRRKKNVSNNRESSNATPSQRVNSYYTASKKQINNFQRHAELQPQKRAPVTKKIKKYLVYTLGIVLVLFVLFAMLTLNKTASISVEEGGSYRSLAEYQRIVADVLKDNYKNNIKFTLDTSSIEQELKKRLPEASEISVYAPLFGRSPEVIITTAKPFATVLQAGSKTMIMTDRGRIAVYADEAAIDTSKLSTVTNKSGTDYKAGDQIFKPEEMKSLNDLQFQFSKGSQDNSGVAYILPLAPREIHVQDGPYIVKYSLMPDLNIIQQYGACRAVQSQLALQGKVPTEYIDVRLATKVFIK